MHAPTSTADTYALMPSATHASTCLPASTEAALGVLLIIASSSVVACADHRLLQVTHTEPASGFFHGRAIACTTTALRMAKLKTLAHDSGGNAHTNIPRVRKGRLGISSAERAKRECNKPLKMFELSITVSMGGEDIDLDLFPKVKTFLEEECVARLCSVERGGIVFHLHFQMVVRIMASLIIAVNKKIKTHLGWDKSSPAGANNVLCRALKQKNMHTFHGMLG
ncbi:hypothetical protein L7F22_026560 [Adiantum nelumboides]|nr:hypothetical protein [Adiantum nelumboides]